MPDAAPRVLELLGPSTGGIRRHVTYLADELRSAGWAVDIAGPAGVLDDLTHEVPVPDGMNPRKAWEATRRLRAIMDHYDLVHAHGLKAGWVASLARRGHRPPVILSVHNLVLREAAGASTGMLRRLEGSLPARVDRTIAVSGEVAERFRGLAGSDRIDVIPPAGPVPTPRRSAAAVRAALGVDDHDDLVVTAARLHPQKDLHLLVSAAELAVGERPGLRWFVFGEGPLRAELESEVSRRGLDGVVHLAGARPDVDDELAAADVVAVTSRWESGPLVVLEALALRRPIVATRVGLVPDAVQAPHGRVVDVGDAAGFAAALVEVLGMTDDGPVAATPADLVPAALASRVADTYRTVLEST